MRVSHVALLLVLTACTQTRHSDFEERGTTRKVTGVVRSIDGVPLRFVKLSAHRGGGGCLTAMYDETSTDEFGRYTLEVTRVERLVSIYVESGSGGLRRVHELDREATRVDFTLGQEVEQEGFVTDSRGVPVEEVIVRTKGGIWARTDRAGHFVIKSVDQGPNELVADHPGHPPLVTAFVAPTPDLRMTLADGVPVRVAVPSPDCKVSALSHRAEEVDAGVYEIAGLPTGEPFELELSCTPASGWFLFRRMIRPPILETITMGHPALRSVRLELSNESGRPVKKVMLLVEVVGDRTVESAIFLETDEAGAASFLVPEGPRKLRLMAFQINQVATRSWNGEPVLRMTLPERLP